MANGILGKLYLPNGATGGIIYTVPAGKLTTCTIRVINDGTQQDISIGITAASSPANDEWIEHDRHVLGIGEEQVASEKSNMIEVTGVVIQAGMKVYIKGNNNSTAIIGVVYGFEDPA